MEPPAPANVAAALSALAGGLLLPYAAVVQGPECVDWTRNAYAEGRLPLMLKALLLAAAAGGLKRELQVHALRSLPPGAAAVLTAARGAAVALVVVAAAR